MKQLFLAAGFLFVLACSDTPAGNTGTKDDTIAHDASVGRDTSVDSSNPASSGFANGTKQCYSNFSNRDTVVLSFTRRDTAVSGELIYQFFQKDRNSGIINGKIKGDTIIADYKFSSEGTTSVRQVVFLKLGDVLVEGFGDVEENNGRMVFRDISTLVFDSSIVFRLTDCNKLPAVK
jgi:hypothetical protein